MTIYLVIDIPTRSKPNRKVFLIVSTKIGLALNIIFNFYVNIGHFFFLPDNNDKSY